MQVSVTQTTYTVEVALVAGVASVLELDVEVTQTVQTVEVSAVVHAVEVAASGLTGPKGDTGATGPSIVSGAFSGDDLVFTKDDSDTVVLAGAKTSLKGDTGEAGVQGPQGVQGETGAQGITGPAGPQGEQGVQGLQGIQGPTGATGPQGEVGPKGDKGDTGATGATGPTGETGAQGAKGDTGATGEAGPKGDTGNTGPQGEQGLQGIQGPAGTNGTNGVDGDDGADGKTWYGGAVDPTTEGVDGDWYLNRTTWHVWEKVSGTWTDRGTIKGADGEGAGDVVGPASSTNEHIAVFNGITGKLLKGGGVAVAGLEPVIATKNTAFNKAFGTGSTDVCVGNDARLSDARTPTSHTHGNLTNDGKIGSTASVPLITGTGGVVQAGSFGTGVGTFCQGNDGRLSDARTPTAHAGTHTNGTDDIQSATASQKGLMTSSQASKLDGIEAGANAYAHPATHSADIITDGTTNKVYTATEQSKLAGIEASADVTDAGNVGSSIHGVNAKTTMADADKLAIIDTEASNALKTLSWSYVKSILKTYMDTLYAVASHVHSSLTSTDNGDITIEPNGTGKVAINKKAVFASQAYYDEEVDATSTVFDLTAGNRQKKTMAGNVTMTITVPSGPASGHIRLIGHASSTYTIAWPSSSPKCVWLTTAMTSITGGKSTVVSWMYDGTNLWLSCPGLVTTP